MVAPVDAPSDAPGTGFAPGQKNTELQSHVAFFDKDGDGVIWPTDTFRGFRDLQFSIFICVAAMFVIHGGLSYPTWGTLLPDPFFRLRISRMHRAKHGSDSESYNSIGAFDPERFYYTFDMYSSPPHTHLTFFEMGRMLRGNRNPFDFFGWAAGAFEWLTTYLLIWPTDPRGMLKEDVMSVYDGSIFWAISGKRRG